MYARRRQPTQLDEHRLLLNGLQPTRRTRERGLLASERPSKRQRTENLNSRYDRMIQTVNIMHPSPIHTSRPKDRCREASSSSATSNDAPKTPEGAYSRPHGCSLGYEFSVLKMGGSRPSVEGSDPFNPEAFASMGTDAKRSIEALPPWLEGTISTLETRNPLRLLLSDDIATGEEHSHYAKHASSSAVSGEKDIPVALTRLATLPATPTFLEDPLANLISGSTIQVRPSINTEFAAWSSHIYDHCDDTVPVKLPFSTPGPASTTSLLPSPALARSPAYPPLRVPATSQYTLDGPNSSAFTPFARPGPCPSTEHTARIPAAQPLHLQQQVTSSPVQDAASAMPRLLQSLLHTLPFSTPGPMPQLVEGHVSTDTNVRFVESPARENLIFHISPSLHDQLQQGSTPDLLYSSPVCTKLSTMPSPASPCSSFVEGSLFSLRDEHEDPTVARPRSGSPLIPCDQYALARSHIDYTALDFKWERFDRGDVVADSTSVSSPRALPGSEETFWSQPAQRLPAIAPPAQRHDGPALDSSPASLRLSGVSTPLPTSPRSCCTQDDRRRPQDGNLFAWIVPPRYAGTPSTPQSKKSSSRMTPKTKAPPRISRLPCPPAPASEARPAKTRGRAQRPGRTPRVADSDTSETQGHSPRPPERRVPFAPCAGIYISPLQDTVDVRDTAGDVNGACEEDLRSGQRPRQVDGGQVASTERRFSTSRACREKRKKAAGDLTSVGRAEDVRQRRETVLHASARDIPSKTVARQGHGADTPWTNVGQGVSQSTVVCSTQSGGGSRGGEEDEIEEIEEDALEGCSQETRDTIESWTA